MCESQFKYTVNTQEFISKWLISDVMEVPFHAEPKPTVFPEYRPGVSVKDKDGKERVSPAKQEFLERGIFRKAGYPAEIVMDQLYYRPPDKGVSREKIPLETGSLVHATLHRGDRRIPQRRGGFHRPQEHAAPRLYGYGVSHQPKV